MNEYKLPKKVLVALPPEMLRKVDFVAQQEHRTRSDLIREALREYLEKYRRKALGSLAPIPLENNIAPIPLENNIV